VVHLRLALQFYTQGSEELSGVFYLFFALCTIPFYKAAETENVGLQFLRSVENFQLSFSKVK